MRLRNDSNVYALLILAGLTVPHIALAADSAPDILSNDFHISAYSYLVTPNQDTELPYAFANQFPGIVQNHQPFMLKPTEQPTKITANIAGQRNNDLAILTKDKQHILTLLDWPKGFDGPMMSVIAKLDLQNPGTPNCSRPINLINDERYYYPSWRSIKVMPIANDDYLIGVQASGADGDGEGIGGWEMIAVLKLTSSCELTLLHKEEDSWFSNSEKTNCYGSHLNFRFLENASIEMVRTTHTCGYPKSKGSISRKTIALQTRN